jgi:hypothetical protein
VVWRAAVNLQLQEQYVLKEKKKFDVAMAEKPGQDSLEAKSYRPITCCTAMYQAVTGTSLMESKAWATGQTAEAKELA